MGSSGKRNKKRYNGKGKFKGNKFTSSSKENF